MNIRHTFTLAVSIGLFLSGCTTPNDEGRANEARLNRLMRHHSWPRIEQRARTEVETRERLLGWPRPDTAEYLPVEHKDKMWLVMATTATPNGDLQRSITLMIGDDGTILAYQRHWK